VKSFLLLVLAPPAHTMEPRGIIYSRKKSTHPLLKLELSNYKTSFQMSSRTLAILNIFFCMALRKDNPNREVHNKKRACSLDLGGSSTSELITKYSKIYERCVPIPVQITIL
jgi:hypothetical protein